MTLNLHAVPPYSQLTIGQKVHDSLSGWGALTGPVRRVSPGTSVTNGSGTGACDVVFTFFTDSWGDAVRRQMCRSGDRLLATLLRHETVDRLLVANPYRSWPIRGARRLLGRSELPFTGSERQLLITPLRLRRRDPLTVPRLERVYAAYDGHLERAASKMGMKSPAVITCNPFVAGFCPLTWAGPVTFYARDDWASYPPHRRWYPAYEAAYRRVAERGHRVCAVSGTIVERVAPTGLATVVPNGLEPDEWQPPWTVPEWFTKLPTPRVLYVGTLQSRIDTHAVRHVARFLTRGSVVLVGPVTEPKAIAPLRTVENVHIRSAVGRKEVAGLVHHADVCIMPHRRTPLTEAMSPLKLYEYLAGGAPVVASDLPPVRSIDARIVLVTEGASFTDGVSRALAMGRASEPERQAFIAANSWSRRHEEILRVALPVTTPVTSG